MSDFIGLTISEIGNLLKSRQASAREILTAHIERIKAKDGQIQAFNTLTEDYALKQADAVDAMIKDGKKPPMMAGVPVALKDNICVPGYPTTCSSRILENFVPPYAATVVSRLFLEGALIIGKTNMDEFAMGSSTENSAFRQTRNPWDLERVPGGSSGGSTAAVASGFVVAALGSDTGGSIRQPAAFCGMVGMKPTYGLVSRFGLVAFASSLDQIGPLARNVEDCATTLSAIAGHDQKDSTSLPQPGPHDFVSHLKDASVETMMKGVKIGLIKELIGEGIDAETQQAVRSAALQFERLGASVEEVSLPNSKFALSVYYIIATAEASANLARYDGVKYGLRVEGDGQAAGQGAGKEAGQGAGKASLSAMYMNTRHDGFGAEVKRRIMLGTYALSTGYYDAYYKKAQQVRRLLKEDFDRVFQSYDLVISPTSPSVAFKLGEKTDDPLKMYLSDIATIPANLAGLPGISIPCGFSNEGLPIGLQILGNALSDALVLKAAYAFEQSTDFHKRKIPMLSGVSMAG